MQLIHVLGKKQEEYWLSLSHDHVVKLFHAENDSKFSHQAILLSCSNLQDSISYCICTAVIQTVYIYTVYIQQVILCCTRQYDCNQVIVNLKNK